MHACFVDNWIWFGTWWTRVFLCLFRSELVWNPKKRYKLHDIFIFWDWCSFLSCLHLLSKEHSSEVVLQCECKDASVGEWTPWTWNDVWCLLRGCICILQRRKVLFVKLWVMSSNGKVRNDCTFCNYLCKNVCMFQENRIICSTEL